MNILNLSLSPENTNSDAFALKVSQSLAKEDINIYTILNKKSKIIDNFKDKNLSFKIISTDLALKDELYLKIIDYIKKNEIEAILISDELGLNFVEYLKKENKNLNLKFIAWFFENNYLNFKYLKKIDFIFIINENQRNFLIKKRIQKEKIVKVKNILLFDEIFKIKEKSNKEDIKKSKTIGIINENQNKSNKIKLIIKSLIKKNYNVIILQKKQIPIKLKENISEKKDKLSNLIEYSNNERDFLNKINLLINYSRSSQDNELQIINAMFNEIPIITCIDSNTKELINNQENGIILKNFTATEVTKATEKIMKNRNFREDLIRKAKEETYWNYSSIMLGLKFKNILGYLLSNEEVINKEETFYTQNIARSIVFNSKNEILITSPDGYNWSLPGGTLEKNISLEELAELETYEETGLRVKTIGFFGTKELNRNENCNWVEGKYIDKKYQVKNIIHIFHCKIIENEKLDENWIDIGHGIIKFTKFIKEEEFKQIDLKEKFLQKLTFAKIKKLKSLRF